MFPQRTRALAATFLVTAAIATAGCAQSTSDFNEGGAGGSTAETGGGGVSDGGTGPGPVGPGGSNSGGIGGTGGEMGGIGGTGGDMGGMGGMGGMMAVEGTTCTSPADLTSGNVSLMGNFTDAISGAGSCDPNATNIAWFSYTAPQDGLYDVSFVNSPSIPAFSRVAIFEGATCAPLGPEVACFLASGPQLGSLVLLHENVTYTMMFYTDGAAYPMENPVASVTPTSFGPGSVCLLAEDLTTETFPYTLAGTFSEDPPDLQPTCDTTVTNVAWFKYTAPATDTFLIDAVNATATNAYSRVAVFETSDCNPHGAQVSCDTLSAKWIVGEADLVSGQEYLIAFYTDGDSYTMVDPTLDISIKPPPPPGGLCSNAVDVTGSLPFQQVGVFNEDPTNATPTCDTTPTNAAWFTFTPATSDWYDISAVNNTTTSASSRLAIFEGTTCTPPGAQLLCGTSSSPSFSTTNPVFLTGGTTYTILFYTSSDIYTMIDPQIDITVGAPPPEGSSCAAPLDLTGQTFPVQQIGNFTEDSSNVAPTCDTTPTNAVWFTFQPTVSDWYDVTAVNDTTTAASSRLAIFEGTTCTPPGAQVFCGTSTSPTFSTTNSVFLTGGTSYTLLFYTSSDTYTMVDPQIDISVGGPPPQGSTCGDPLDVTGQSFPVQQVGDFTDDPSNVAPTCDTTPTNAVWFTYQPAVSDWYGMTFTNHTTDNSYSRVAIFEGATCAPTGPQLYCGLTDGLVHSVVGGVFLDASTTYAMVFYTDGDSYAMEDPELSIVPQPEGAVCGTAANVSSQSFPFTLTGTFSDDPPVAGSCDTTPTNAVWYDFTPTVTQAYTITGVNASSTNAYSRLAIFDGASCNPQGTELGCAMNASLTATLSNITLTAGMPYRIVFYTDGNSYTMVNPTLTITP